MHFLLGLVCFARCWFLTRFNQNTGILYSLSTSSPPLAPTFFSHTTRSGVPLRALLATSSISLLCFGSSFIGSGELWGWLQNIVGVSNQIARLSIGLASWRWRKAWKHQGRELSEMKFRAGWTWGWGPQFVIVAVTGIILCKIFENPKLCSLIDSVNYSTRMVLLLSKICRCRFHIILYWDSCHDPYDTHLVHPLSTTHHQSFSKHPSFISNIR